jgi:hypothetical protein
MPDSQSETQQPTKTDATKTTAEPKNTGDAKSTGDSSSEKQTAKETGSSKVTGKASGTKTTGKPKATSFDPRLPAGGVSMVTPGALAGAQYYKIGDWVTFAWNYTSLSVTPSAVDILATCTANQATYTLAVNQSVQETGMVLWDTGAYQETATVPLLTETYTLIIYDAESSVSATAAAGYLAPYNQFTFGMYTPQPYVKWADFKCANCNPNGALSAFDSLTFRALLITSGTTVGSLLYFAYSFGVL